MIKCLTHTRQTIDTFYFVRIETATERPTINFESRHIRMKCTSKCKDPFQSHLNKKNYTFDSVKIYLWPLSCCF